MDSQHTHKEAFCLMWYACKDCGARERIWNSRDGVTPFGMGCPSCGSTMHHVDWNRDQYAPGHTLAHGQRFWRDGTPDEAEAFMRIRIDLMRDTHPCTPEYAAELIANARDPDSSTEFRRGWPMLDVHTRTALGKNEGQK